MPQYDYQCDECVEIFEVEHAMSYTGPVTCPVCKTGLTHKIFLQVPAIAFKWWNAAASSDSGNITRRFHAATENLKAKRAFRRGVDYGNNA